MELQEILSQPDGFCPPSVTVKIEKAFKRTAGEGDNGPWSYQDVQVTGGKLKLKNVDPFPEDRIGETVTLKAFQSKQHGLTGLKVAHEEYQGKTYDKLVITPTAIWEWQNSNGHALAKAQSAQSKPELRTVRDEFNLESHLSECARIATSLAEQLGITEDSARQACFATVCIDAQRHNVILGDSLPSEAPKSDPRKDALLGGVKSACKLLNDEGYEPRFTPKVLDEYVNERFETDKGVAGLSADDTEDLIQSLSEKLDNFRMNKHVDENSVDDDDDVPF